MNQSIDNSLFFKIIRDKYIRFNIRNYLFNFKIEISLKDLFNNQTLNHLISFNIPLLLKVNQNEFLEYHKSFIKFINNKNNYINNLIQHIVFIDGFNEKIPIGFIGKQVKFVDLGDDFDQDLEIGTFPQDSELEKLVFSYSFNRPIKDDLLPSGLKVCYFSRDFNQCLGENTIPKSVTKLRLLEEMVEQKITNNMLPPNLTFLKFSGTVDRDFKFPSTLTSLSLVSFTSRITTNLFPSTLDTLRFLDVVWSSPLSKEILPSNLKHLYFENDYPYSLDILPDSLTSLDLGFHLNTEFQQPLPRNLKRLIFSLAYDKPLPYPLPSSLTYLEMQNFKTCTFKPGFIPASVKTLVYCQSPSAPLTPGVIPEGVTSLTFPYSFNSLLQHGSIPSSVKHIEFKSIYSFSIEKDVIPSSVESFIIRIKDQELDISLPPENTCSISFYFKANVPLYKPLLFGITHLDYISNKEINSEYIPSSVTSITFRDYNIELKKGDIPNGVKELSLGTSFRKPIDPNTLPDSLTKLSLNKSIYFKFNENIPKSVKYLSLYVYHDHLIKIERMKLF
ncbi:hypothetical protein CYY_003719 [Polysphondylium violaceum]|uniref:FNIP repeat-containing protein n=1 Tax=Polysphondylium violaceum TaxID=133409 RepID=A0A8J4PWD2_9MYCE|nr:hypothetical protein CYY_003719 [Polysphondylium violaceum]